MNLLVPEGKNRRHIAIVMALWVFVAMLPAAGHAAEAYDESIVTFPIAKSADGGRVHDIRGTLRVPKSGDKRPAVVIIHNAGQDATGQAYAFALTQAGFVTLELELWRGRRDHQRPTPYLAHTFGALQFLATHPRVDPARIGGMGFSLGGILNIRAATDYFTQKYTAGNPRFAAHLALYPVCWIHLNAQEGKSRTKELQGIYSKVTGAPVHILAGATDEYDEPDTCAKFLASIPPDARKNFKLTVYPDAGHGWDAPSSRTYNASEACLGRGCTVNHRRVESRAQDSSEYAMKFFTEVLKP
ncbi:MAG TPA: dienelactone hydrolase family protein [Burkholderiales bacterium]|nr:dienelactone hydrolase family protein [Burkholderiales bacterium]